jgi:phage tail protein X
MSTTVKNTTKAPAFMCMYSAHNVVECVPQLADMFANMPSAVDRVRHTQHHCLAALRRYNAKGFTSEQIVQDIVGADPGTADRHISINLGFALSLPCADHQALTRYAQTLSTTEYQIATAIKTVASFVEVDLLALTRLQAKDTVAWFCSATHYREHLIAVDVVLKDDLAAAKDFLRLFQKDLNAPLDDALAKNPFDENSAVRKWHCGESIIHMTELFKRLDRVMEKFQPYFSSDDQKPEPTDEVDDLLTTLPRYSEFVKTFASEITSKVFWAFKRIEEKPPEHLHGLLDQLMLDVGQHIDVQAAYLEHLGSNPAAVHEWALRPNREEILIRELFDKMHDVEYMGMRYGDVHAAKCLLKTLDTETVLRVIRQDQSALLKAYALLGDQRFIAAMKESTLSHTLEIDLGL